MSSSPGDQRPSLLQVLRIEIDAGNAAAGDFAYDRDKCVLPSSAKIILFKEASARFFIWMLVGGLTEDETFDTRRFHIAGIGANVPEGFQYVASDATGDWHLFEAVK